MNIFETLNIFETFLIGILPQVSLVIFSYNLLKLIRFSAKNLTAYSTISCRNRLQNTKKIVALTVEILWESFDATLMERYDPTITQIMLSKK